ncbi:hypothetical protein MA16_Dca013517 [Dendrobium catenatum]|uniref:Uncharacterized protein n=1 Tax=Dendrobium catenatum TaxID=906689 RepID=A0A2I0W499_9ASPA|nr:hypothetical protein MA16_Dca013517 [Dendrobium catenatum]
MSELPNPPQDGIPISDLQPLALASPTSSLLHSSIQACDQAQPTGLQNSQPRRPAAAPSLPTAADQTLAHPASDSPTRRMHELDLSRPDSSFAACSDSVEQRDSMTPSRKPTPDRQRSTTGDTAAESSTNRQQRFDRYQWPPDISSDSDLIPASPSHPAMPSPVLASAAQPSSPIHRATRSILSLIDPVPCSNLTQKSSETIRPSNTARLDLPATIPSDHDGDRDRNPMPGFQIVSAPSVQQDLQRPEPDSASRFTGFFSTSASLASSPPPRGSADRLRLSMLQSCVSAADTRLALDAIMVSANSGRKFLPKP